MNRSLTGATFAALAAATFATAALAADPIHMRGTLAAVDGKMIVVKSEDGGAETVTLNEDAGLFQVSQGKIQDIAAGQFVGITSIESGGERVAIEVHIFNEELRGLAEGHYPWDLVSEPNMMTNAAVASVVEASDDRTLTVTYAAEEAMGGSGEQTINVPADATIVHFDKTTPDALVKGASVFMIAVENEEGDWISPALVVGSDGVQPPM